MNLYKDFGISDRVWEFCEKIEDSLALRFSSIDKTAEYNQARVILAMKKNRVSTACLTASTGYGYDDLGRDTLEAVYADIFHTEAALVRPQITCGTHALTIALRSVLRPGDELISAVGAPYDTLEEVIGVRESVGSLAEFGISYKAVALTDKGLPDLERIKKAISDKTRLVTIQRSKGYTSRASLSVEQIGEIISVVKGVRPDIICMVDNCYGEFTQKTEPSDVGADMCVGSLIKNPGGGLAPSGGYIVGTNYCIERCAAMLNAPGLGREVGANLGTLPNLYQGLFLAPCVVAGALKGAVYCSGVFEALGYKCGPRAAEERYDIIEAVELGSAEKMLAFARGIQSAAPVDSFVTPVAAPMPGYDSEVVMAAGTFIQGSSIELSCDGPIRAPYTVYYQGGLTYPHAKLGVMSALQSMADDDSEIFASQK